MNTSTSNTLSAKDRKRLTQLQRFIEKHDRFPSYRELGEVFRVASTNAVQKILRRFEDVALLERDAHGRWRASSGLVGIPLRGTVGASWPSPAEEELTDAITLDDYLIENKQASFLLRVSGDSMIDAGIHPDDLVIVQRGRAPKNGDIVIAQVDHAWTMKRFEKRGKNIRLLAENAEYPPIIPTEEITIDGVVTGVIRKYY